jgi:hypothetical protein
MRDIGVDSDHQLGITDIGRLLSDIDSTIRTLFFKNFLRSISQFIDIQPWKAYALRNSPMKISNRADFAAENAE